MTDRRTRGRTWSPPRISGAELAFPGSHAIERLERLRYIIPRAVGKEGVAIADVARELDVDPETVVADVRHVEEREFHYPPGEGDELQVLIEPERVRIRTSLDLKRPAKLSQREALSLWLALEVVRVSTRAEGDATRGTETLRRRLERHLVGSPDPDAADTDPPFAAPALTADPGGVRQAVSEAATEHRVCVLRYLKAKADEIDDRRVRPYALVHAEGRWYLLAHCEATEEVRTFRLDRTIEVDVMEERFAPPEDFDPADHMDVEGGRVFDPGTFTEATVRYSPTIARWIAEREEGRWAADGSYTVRHRVADPAWLVRHVLRYAGEAEVMEPEGLRERVGERAAEIAAVLSP